MTSKSYGWGGKFWRFQLHVSVFHHIYACAPYHRWVIQPSIVVDI